MAAWLVASCLRVIALSPHAPRDEALGAWVARAGTWGTGGLRAAGCVRSGTTGTKGGLGVLSGRDLPPLLALLSTCPVALPHPPYRSGG